MLQGGGSCTYELGVLDDGRCIGICPTEMRTSLRVLASLASELEASVRVRRAFVLLESEQQSLNAGKVNELRSLGNEEAQSRLSTEGDLPACNCKAGEEVLAWQEAKVLGKSFVADADNRKEAYRVDIDEAREDFIGGSWMGESDIDSYRENGQANDIDEVEIVDDEGFTFSLSLDEMATRQGVGHHRRRTPRKCRYLPRGAQIKKQKAISTTSKAAKNMISTQSSISVATDANIEIGILPSCAETPVADESLSITHTCERIIVEAVVCRITEELSPDFIDYASL
jgi:hypothetical protein